MLRAGPATRPAACRRPGRRSGAARRSAGTLGSGRRRRVAIARRVKMSQLPAAVALKGETRPGRRPGRRLVGGGVLGQPPHSAALLVHGVELPVSIPVRREGNRRLPGCPGVAAIRRAQGRPRKRRSASIDGKVGREDRQRARSVAGSSSTAAGTRCARRRSSDKSLWRRRRLFAHWTKAAPALGRGAAGHIPSSSSLAQAAGIGGDRRGAQGVQRGGGSAARQPFPINITSAIRRQRQGRRAASG